MFLSVVIVVLLFDFLLNFCFEVRQEEGHEPGHWLASTVLSTENASNNNGYWSDANPSQGRREPRSEQKR